MTAKIGHMTYEQDWRPGYPEPQPDDAEGTDTDDSNEGRDDESD